jgi:hypothetical protein
MDRRAFLRTLTGGAVAATFVSFDPERALWVPGKKLISIPQPRFDPRFLVHVRAGAPGCYRIPEGTVYRVTEKLPRYEIPLARIDYSAVILRRGATPGRPEAVWVNRHGPDGFLAIELYPVPTQDTVVAIEYFPTQPYLSFHP